MVLFIMFSLLLFISACQIESSNFLPLSGESQDYGGIFSQGKITEINVEIEESDWNDLVENAKEETYYSVDLTINGKTITNVGFRAKGYSSLITVADSESNRYGFRVKLDKYMDDQTINGLDTFVLNASFADPSYMREYLTYAASAHLGVMTPNLAYTKLSINGEFFGLYLAIEAYDDSFVERYTDSKDTVLYKADSESCTLTLDDDTSGFDVKYGEDDDYSNIKQLIRVLNETTEDNKEQLEEILDIDSVLKAIAVNTVMGNYDSYSGSKAHNYYLLYENGKFSYIGWDYNMSIGGFSEDNGASVTVDINEPIYNVELSQRPLIEKLLAIDEYKATYLSYVQALIDYFDNFETQVDEIAQLIREYVEIDPTAFYTIEDFEASLVESGTDLTQIQAKMPAFKNDSNGQLPNGEEMPQPPSDLGEGDMPQLPSELGEEMPQPPSHLDEDIPEKMPSDVLENQPPMGNKGGGGLLTQDAVSIMDYMLQRIENIKTQLLN